ncbi:CsiV family protein [Idiomarina xiamenensis]|uniref:Peptidoglycan-binding protein, CsiV n=1 Tax=Idiomarina xiamenensis 10-D-4 TaxID=740709 RepID=K2KYZ7_9GAMM|nr:CsiV family protein [Idiomarina xiamenensis]EKE82955.1 hypothetical protein A10D4_08949 [Idiomarina xiamenensis 10-D-4]
MTLTISTRRLCLTLLVAASSLLLPLVPATASAQSAASTTQPATPTNNWRWFEVEVLVFRHTIGQTVAERFPLAIQPQKISGSDDLLSPYFEDTYRRALLAGLDDCQVAELMLETPLLSCRYHDELELLPLPGAWQGEKPSALRGLAKTDVVIDGAGGDIYQAQGPFLLPADSLELDDMRQQLVRSGQAEPILHLAWRQPVFNRNSNNKIRLFGGVNFSEDYDYLGYQRDDTDNLSTMAQQNGEQPLTRMQRIDKLLSAVDQQQLNFTLGEHNSALNSPALPPKPAYRSAGLPQQVWELDGLMHIFLVGNYLHIDSDLNLREEAFATPAAGTLAEQAEQALAGQTAQQRFLRAYHFAQLRRVISHETHYFDHPKFGVVVQIRRTDLSARR